MPHRNRTRLRSPIALATLLMVTASMMSIVPGCGSSTQTVSWKPQAATQQKPRPRPSTRPAGPSSTMAGADLLDEAHRASKVTWVSVPTPDGKKMRWVQVK